MSVYPFGSEYWKLNVCVVPLPPFGVTDTTADVVWLGVQVPSVVQPAIFPALFCTHTYTYLALLNDALKLVTRFSVSVLPYPTAHHPPTSTLFPYSSLFRSVPNVIGPSQ